MARILKVKFIVLLSLALYLADYAVRNEFAAAEITDLEWEEDFAYWSEWPRHKENADIIGKGRTVTLTARTGYGPVAGYGDADIPICIYQYDPDGDHGLVDVVQGKVSGNTISAQWKVKILDHQGQYDLKCYQPMLFFAIDQFNPYDNYIRKSGLLPVYDWYEVNMEGAEDDIYTVITPDWRHITGPYRKGSWIFVDKLPCGNSILSLEKQHVSDVCNVKNRDILSGFSDWNRIKKIVFGACPVEGMVGKYGFTEAHLAALQGRIARVRELIPEWTGINTRAAISPWSPATPLDFAALGGHVHLARALVEKGASVTRSAEYDTTLLHFAIAGGNLDMVKYALSMGFDINARNARGETFLHYAARKGTLEIVRYFVDNGGNAGAKSLAGAGVMHFAAAGSEIGIVRYLRLKGIALDSKTRDGGTPLHYAAMSGTVPCVRYLLREGLSPWDVTDDGLTPFHFSVMGANHFVPNYLVLRFLAVPPPDSPEGSVRESALIHVKDRRGRGLLHYCAWLDDPAVARYLIHKGIDVNAVDYKGLTAADYAEKTRNGGLLSVINARGKKAK